MPSAREEAIIIAKQKIAARPVYLDTETTGTGKMDSIVEIAIIDHDGSVLVDSLVRPIGRIPAGATAIHGITNKMVKNAPDWQDVWTQVESALKDRQVGIYNADFDLRMLRQTHANNWMRWENPPGSEFFCIMKLYAQFYGRINPKYGSYVWQSLDAARKQCGLSLPHTHRAKKDALLTRELLKFIAGNNF